MSTGHLMACHDCDLLYRMPAVPHGMTATCGRCGAVLARPKRNGLERSLALAMAGLVLFLLANSFPFLGFKVQGQVRETLLLTGIWELYLQGLPHLALLVLVTTVLAPLAQLLALVYVLLPLKCDRPAPGMFRVFRWLRSVAPWSMTEVFMLGILVSLVKLAKMAEIIPGTAAFCFMALIIVLAACMSSLDAHEIWGRWEEPQ
ncbi:MAG: paraquat-inducible protein A [Desulfobacteraceae bacterium]|jgi:paraquat-inducible protein A